jgi:Na+-transporting NADH:ubiquinone oxidoreductase subunit F
MIYITGLTVFLSVMLLLVVMLLFLEALVIDSKDSTITINDDPKKSIKAKGGATLLSAFSENDIYLPSACGGKGACGMCKCVVQEGGMGVLPTELAHLTRKERKNNVRLSCQLKVRQDMKVKMPDEIFSIQKYDAVVQENRNVATFIKLLVAQLDPGQEVDFKAGNYMQIDIPSYELSYKEYDVGEGYRPTWERAGFFDLASKSEETVFRAFSLANPPSKKNVLKFTVRIATPPALEEDTPPGVGSSYIFNLKPDDRITLSGPYGEFYVEKTQREICFIGGGAGMAPMRSHILDQLEDVKTQRVVSFWYGARSKQEMFFDDEFKQLAKKHDNFTYQVALSDPQPEDSWEGMTGFIHQCLYDSYLKTHDDPTEIEYYLCGPPMMVDAVMDMLDNLGVEPEMIHFDKF